jgi:hypothetical protein
MRASAWSSVTATYSAPPMASQPCWRAIRQAVRRETRSPNSRSFSSVSRSYLGFWRAVLEYAPMADDNGIDPLGQGSTVWMQ